MNISQKLNRVILPFDIDNTFFSRGCSTRRCNISKNHLVLRRFDTIDSLEIR